MSIEELFDNELYHNYGMLTTDDANCLINYLKEETMEYITELQKELAEEARLNGMGVDGMRQRITELEFDKANMVDRIIGLEIHKTGVIGQGNRIAELEARNKEMMCAMREWYEDGFNRGDCGELIVKHGGDA